MATEKPRIQVTLEPDMHKKILELAVRDGRSASNFIEHQLRKLLGPHLEPVFTPKQMQQIDIHEAIAEAVKKGPVRKRSKRR